MDIFRLFTDGAVLSFVCIYAVIGKWRGRYSLLYAFGLVFMALEVYFIYRGQENSDLFFWHGYAAWSIGSIAALAISLAKRKKAEAGRLLMERLLLWQGVVVTVFAGFSLTVGWLLKLYVGVFIR